MGLTRRQFLKWAGATSVGAVVFNGCRVPDHELEIQSPVELPEDLVTGRDNFYATVAQHGAASEGLIVRVMEGRAKKVEGNPDYPINTGKHHIKSEALLQATYHPDRIQRPLQRLARGGPFREIDWPTALSALEGILGDADPASVLIATNPVRGRLADVVNGFANNYGASAMGFEPLDQTVLRTAVKNVFNQDTLPDFDIAHADFILSFGADFLGTWVDPTHFMRGYGEFRQGEGREHRGYLVHLDSRYSLTAAAADQWHYVEPGTEGLLAMAIIHTLLTEGNGDSAVVDALTDGAGRNAFSQFAPAAVVDRIRPTNAPVGLSEQQIVDLAHRFAESEHALAIGGGSAGAHTNGLFNLTAIYALNYLVGAVNREGGVILNPADMFSEVPAAPASEWKAAIESMRAGDTSVLLVREADLVHGLSSSLDVEDALSNVGSIVSFSPFLDDTTAMADLILPGSTALEEWGTDTPLLGPGYQTVAFQQPVIRRYRDTLAFGDVLLQTAAALGTNSGVEWGSMQDAVRAAAVELHDEGRGSVVLPTFEEFWKRTRERGGWWDQDSRVNTTPTPPALPRSPASAEIAGNPSRYPFALVPFEGHALGQGQYAHLPWAQGVPDPLTTVAWTTWVELNPIDAEAYRLQQDDVVTVDAPNGNFIRAAVYVNPATPPGVAAIPIGQGHDHFTSYAANRGANVLDLIEQLEDSETGGLAWAATRIRITKTNTRARLPKYEGLEEARQLPHEEVILVHREGQQPADH